MSTQNSSPDSTPPQKRISAISKVIIIGVASLVGFFVLQLLDPKWRPHAGSLTNNVVVIAATCFVPWVLGGLFALFVKGRAGIVIGVVVIGIVYGLVFIGDSFEREAVNSAAKDLNEIKKEAVAQLDKTGDVDLSVSRLGESLSNILSAAVLFSIQDSNTLAAVVAVMSPLLECRTNADLAYAQMIDPQFMNPTNWRTTEDLESRLVVYRKYRNAYEKQTSLCRTLDVALETELRRRGITPLKAKTFAENVFNHARLEQSVGIAQCNVGTADVGIRQLGLIKSNWGKWRLERGQPVFESRDANDEWTQTMRDWLRVTAAKEALLREWANSK